MLSNTIDTLSRRAAFNMYIDGLKQEGRMSNIPVLAKVTELSDAFLKKKKFSEVKLHKNSEDYEKQSIVNNVLISSANELGYKLSNVYNLDKPGEVLATLYRTVYNDIHKPGFIPYSELTKMYLENPNDSAVKELLSKHQLLQSIMGSMASLT